MHQGCTKIKLGIISNCDCTFVNHSFTAANSNLRDNDGKAKIYTCTLILATMYIHVPYRHARTTFFQETLQEMMTLSVQGPPPTTAYMDIHVCIARRQKQLLANVRGLILLRWFI